MHEVDFDALESCFRSLFRITVILHSRSKILAEKYPAGIYEALTDDQRDTIRDYAERIHAIDFQLGLLMAGPEPEPKVTTEEIVLK